MFRAELGSGESALEARAPSLSVFYSVPDEAGLTQSKPQGLPAFPWGHSLALWNLLGNGLLGPAAEAHAPQITPAVVG